MNYEKGGAYTQLKKDFAENLKRDYHTQNILSLILKNFTTEKEIKVLEYGPGLGIMADLLYESYSSINYTAIDIDQNILHRIKNKHIDAEIKEVNSFKDLCEFLSDKKFDVIIALDVWEHIPATELNAYTEESLKHLSRGGMFIAQVPNWGCPFTSNVIFAGDITHCNPFNEISARQLLLKNGADINNIKILPYHFPQNGFLNFIRSMIRPMLLIMYRAFLFLLGLHLNGHIIFGMIYGPILSVGIYKLYILKLSAKL